MTVAYYLLLFPIVLGIIAFVHRWLDVYRYSFSLAIKPSIEHIREAFEVSSYKLNTYDVLDRSKQALITQESFRLQILEEVYYGLFRCYDSNNVITFFLNVLFTFGLKYKTMNPNVILKASLMPISDVNFEEEYKAELELFRTNQDVFYQNLENMYCS